MTFNIPEDKVSDIAALAADILQKRKVKVRLLARLVGKLQSVRLATGPIVSIMTRLKTCFLKFNATQYFPGLFM